MEVDICELITLPRIKDGVDARRFFDSSVLPFDTRVFRPVVGFGHEIPKDEQEGSEAVILEYLGKMARNTEVDEAAATMDGLSKMKLDDTEVAQQLFSKYSSQDEIDRKLAKEAAEYLEKTYRKGEKEREVLDKFLKQ